MGHMIVVTGEKGTYPLLVLSAILFAPTRYTDDTSQMVMACKNKSCNVRVIM